MDFHRPLQPEGDHEGHRARGEQGGRDSGIEAPFSLTDVYSADEAFVTGTFGALTPVTEVDGREIGNGAPGPMTARLQDLYDRAVAADVGV